MPGNRYVWKEGQMDFYEYYGEHVTDADNCGIWDNGNAKECWKQTGKRKSVTKCYGGNYQIGSSPEFSSDGEIEPKGIDGRPYDKDGIDLYYESEPRHDYNNYLMASGGGENFQQLNCLVPIHFQKRDLKICKVEFHILLVEVWY